MKWANLTVIQGILERIQSVFRSLPTTLYEWKETLGMLFFGITSRGIIIAIHEPSLTSPLRENILKHISSNQ